MAKIDGGFKKKKPLIFQKSWTIDQELLLLNIGKYEDNIDH